MQIASDAMIRARKMLTDSKIGLPEYIWFDGDIFKVIKKPNGDVQLELKDQPNDK